MSTKRASTHHTDLSSRSQKRMVALLRVLAPEEGYNLTALPSVRILRSNRALSRTPVLYDPGIVIVCQGRKRGYFGDRLYLYDEHHCLAVSVPVPFRSAWKPTQRLSTRCSHCICTWTSPWPLSWRRRLTAKA
jgi:hypothetical protein